MTAGRRYFHAQNLAAVQPYYRNTSRARGCGTRHFDSEALHCFVCSLPSCIDFGVGASGPCSYGIHCAICCEQLIFWQMQPWPTHTMDTWLHRCQVQEYNALEKEKVIFGIFDLVFTVFCCCKRAALSYNPPTPVAKIYGLSLCKLHDKRLSHFPYFYLQLVLQGKVLVY